MFPKGHVSNQSSSYQNNLGFNASKSISYSHALHSSSGSYFRSWFQSSSNVCVLVSVVCCATTKRFFIKTKKKQSLVLFLYKIIKSKFCYLFFKDSKYFCISYNFSLIGEWLRIPLSTNVSSNASNSILFIFPSL